MTTFSRIRRIILIGSLLSIIASAAAFGGGTHNTVAWQWGDVEAAPRMTAWQWGDVEAAPRMTAWQWGDVEAAPRLTAWQWGDVEAAPRA